MGNRRNILVIGGAGFIGSHLVDLCIKKGYNTFVYDNFSTGKMHHLKGVPYDNIIVGDILDAECLSRAIEISCPATIFHLAAIHHIPTCEKQPKKAFRVNIEGTLKILELAKGVERFVFASTGALYDPANRGPLSEESPLNPIDIYGISKMTCENLLKYFSLKDNIGVISARLFNSVGRRETNRHLIPDIVDQLIEGKREILLGNLTPLRDYIHVEDVAEALLLLGEIETSSKWDVFNVGTGVEHSVVDLVSIFSEVIGEEIKVVSVPELRRRIDRPTQKADITKLSSITGFLPKRTLKTAVKEVWDEALCRVRS